MLLFTYLLMYIYIYTTMMTVSNHFSATLQQQKQQIGDKGYLKSLTAIPIQAQLKTIKT